MALDSSLTVSVHNEHAVARLLGMDGRLHAVLLRAVNRLSVEVQRAVKQTKLTGQVLHVRTGTLRRSINRVVADGQHEIIATVGTNVSYAAIHEYGFKGVVNVRAHVRQHRERAQQYKKSGRLTGTSSEVRAHTRSVDMPERSFLRSTLRDFDSKITQDLRDAAVGVLK